ncbi:MAG TPA: transcription termination factor NusA [Candidatus Pacearchaeota archaeon]|nr:transcription termination/antitermination protein NusA [Candidatus Parcubacteria bacterium]HOU45685.1 transcription termination factor NusA [Candidatus Pacearchaeota archaeon]HPM08500.1 transcription termination factor NusA [Candidatus Pacearchaeota archaeon]HQI74614.1 transcription termination factor NusA [Candidatus Pacearchaeota archaeon]
MDLKSFKVAIKHIAEEKGIPQDRVLEAAEAALAAAYKKEYGEKPQVIKSKFDPENGIAEFWQVKSIVNKKMIYSEKELEELKAKRGVENAEDIEEDPEDKKIVFNPEKHIMIDDAQEIDEDAEVGDDITIPLPSQIEFGRIAAQTAKQVFLQKVKEIERTNILSRFKEKEGDVISGVVQRIEARAVILDIGKAFAILPKEEQIQGEFYRPDQRFKVFILKVEDTAKGPVIYVSRSHPKLISKLFELEVPEIGAEQVKIASIAREAGFRTKIAVSSDVEGIDPIGAMVGQRGTRIAVVINELGGEKIDVIEASDDPEKFIANALAPAKILEVKVMPKNVALAIVEKDQLSLAIGKGGQNVRLAARLTGWKIDIKVQGEENQDVIEVNEQGEIVKKNYQENEDAQDVQDDSVQEDNQETDDSNE